MPELIGKALIGRNALMVFLKDNPIRCVVPVKIIKFNPRRFNSYMYESISCHTGNVFMTGWMHPKDFELV